jgi:CheY-like chemotaxis protein
MQMTLQALGYEVVCATDLAQLAVARNRGPSDLVLMDVQMPEGIEPIVNRVRSIVAP